MELAEIRPFEPQMAEIDLFTMPDAVGVGESSVRKVKSYLKGHVTDGSSTFTIRVNNTDIVIPVDANGNWKYKPTAAITSLAFVGVPQLESLELNKITGVSTFNLDYPVVPVFKKCDATTEAALNYVYHIRGTATSDFTFSLKYIADGTGTVTTVTESAVIDGNGNWDVSYSGKKIRSASLTFKNNAYITSICFTESFELCNNIYQMFLGANNLVVADFPNGLFNNNQFGSEESKFFFRECAKLKNVYLPKATFENIPYTNLWFNSTLIEELNLPQATFKNTTNFIYTFYQMYSLKSLKLEQINLPTDAILTEAFTYCSSLTDLYVPNNALASSVSLKNSPLTYESMLRVAGWLKDLTGVTAQTVTFKADTYNALTAEQKAELEGIIVTQKGWVLATA